MNFVDVEVTCGDCGNQFVYTAGEQLFFHSKGFTHLPKTCRTCRSQRAGAKPRKDHTVTCADCGLKTTVPFAPSQNRPVYCRQCFEKRKSN